MALSATRTESSGLREFLNSSRGKIVSFVAAALMLIVAGYLVWRAIAPSEAESVSNDRWFVDAKTMKGFQHELKMGEHVPVEAPSGGATGSPAERCYWTKDGQTKKQPTAVLLNRWQGKAEPTFCPDCGRLVVGHNPAPTPGAKAPPTEAEYKTRGGGGGAHAPSRDGR